MYLVAASNDHMVWWFLAAFCSFTPDGPADEELAYLEANDGWNLLVIDCYNWEIVYRQDYGKKGEHIPPELGTETEFFRNLGAK